MATVYKTPGVYVEEIPKLPPSVAQVETAIPAFIGYTQKAVRRGESLINIPVRVSSMVEFIDYYGRDKSPESIDVATDENNNYAILGITLDPGNLYYMYNSLRLFFDNGGGDCYIVSVGLFDAGSVAAGDENDPANSRGLRLGVKAIEKVDEPTILLFPDAVLLADASEYYSLQQMAIAQCVKLQDRVSVLDIKENDFEELSDAIVDFRDKIGINGLKYAAAYTPWLYTTYPVDVAFEQFSSSVYDSADPGNLLALSTLTANSALNTLVTNMEVAVADSGNVDAAIDAICDAGANGNVPASASGALEAPTMKDRYLKFVDGLKAAGTDGAAKAALNILINFVRQAAFKFQDWDGAFASAGLNNDVDSYAASPSLWRGAVTDLIKIEKNDDVRGVTDVAARADVNAGYSSVNADWLGAAVADIKNLNNDGTTEGSGKDYAGALTDKKTIALIIEKDINAAFEKLVLFAESITNAAANYKKSMQDLLYEGHPIISNIVRGIKKELSKLPPGGAIAGIYARVDNARGVWKAPANESINSVSAPSDLITAEEQSALNVDPVAGKSINAIRAFTGKGTLVWGARTLMGNDNEWRYISVRRFFNMVEESCKKSTEPFVFEPNDANTWVKVQGMIENFLTVLWRQGALQGAKPEHAFYVAIGLGKTMTAFDILEGRMIVEIGMAVVRPAEFIMLQFSHKMAES